jgi:type I restriction enzyme S subunit
MSDASPDGWTAAPLGAIAAINPRHPKGLDDSMPVSFVPMAGVSESKPDFQFVEERPLGEVRQGFTHFADGDVLFAKITPCMENGKGAIATGLSNGIGCGTTELMVLRPFGGISPHYLYRFLAQPVIRTEAKEHFTGTAGQARVPTRFIQELEIPLAPLAEQQRIVAKLEDLIDKVDACQNRLGKVQTLLKRFRQSVLDAAISGKLTSDWRRLTSATLNASSELKSLLAASERQRSGTREAQSTEGHEAFNEAIPDEWAVPSLDDLFRFIDYRGRTPTKSKSGKRLISAKNIKRGYISDEPVEFVSEHFYRDWMTRGFPNRGDIFFVTEGHTMGFAALNNREDEFALSQRTITLQPWQQIETRCFLYFIMSSPFQNLVRLNATGSAAVGIKAAKFRGLPIPFPAISEQVEIANRVEALFALADRIEVRQTKVQAYVSRLIPALIGKAFSGELVPTEATLAEREGREYEPASVLLDRIKRSRAEHEGASVGRRGNQSVATTLKKRSARSVGKPTSNKRRYVAR